MWKEIIINNNINGIIEHISYFDSNNNIIIFGGITENGFNKNYYKINLKNNKLINIGLEKDNESNLLFNSQIILIRSDLENENFLLCFDKKNNIHRFSQNEIINQIIVYN